MIQVDWASNPAGGSAAAKCRWCSALNRLRLVDGEFECRDRRRCEWGLRKRAAYFRQTGNSW